MIAGADMNGVAVDRPLPPAVAIDANNAPSQAGDHRGAHRRSDVDPGVEVPSALCRVVSVSKGARDPHHGSQKLGSGQQSSLSAGSEREDGAAQEDDPAEHQGAYPQLSGGRPQKGMQGVGTRAGHLY